MKEYRNRPEAVIKRAEYNAKMRKDSDEKEKV
jgi:hypothetical protein